MKNVSPSSLKILIVEDDLSFALELSMLVEKIGYQVLEQLDNSAEALEVIYADRPDLILMDVDIKGRMNGLEIGQQIQHLDIPILYITSFETDEHYQAAQQSNMIGYLVKPVSKYSLITTINLAVCNMHGGQKSTEEENDFMFKEAFFFKKKQVYHKVAIDEISYIESDDKYCMTYTTKNEKFLARITMSKLEECLPANLFMRIHRTYLVGLHQISSVNFFEGTLQIGDKVLPVSRANRKLLQQRMMRFD